MPAPQSDNQSLLFDGSKNRNLSVRTNYNQLTTTQALRESYLGRYNVASLNPGNIINSQANVAEASKQLVPEKSIAPFLGEHSNGPKKDKKQLILQSTQIKATQIPYAMRMKIKRNSTEINDPNLQANAKEETIKVEAQSKQADQIELHIQRLHIHGRATKKEILPKYIQPRPFKIVKKTNKRNKSKLILEEPLEGQEEISRVESEKAEGKNQQTEDNCEHLGPESNSEIHCPQAIESNNISKEERTVCKRATTDIKTTDSSPLREKNIQGLKKEIMLIKNKNKKTIRSDNTPSKIMRKNLDIKNPPKKNKSTPFKPRSTTINKALNSRSPYPAKNSESTDHPVEQHIKKKKKANSGLKSTMTGTTSRPVAAQKEEPVIKPKPRPVYASPDFYTVFKYSHIQSQ